MNMKKSLLFSVIVVLMVLYTDVFGQHLDPKSVNLAYAKVVNQKRHTRRNATKLRADVNLFCLTLVRNEYIRNSNDTTVIQHKQFDVEIVGKITGLAYSRTPRIAAKRIYTDVERKLQGTRGINKLRYANASVLGDYYVVRFYTNPSNELLAMDIETYKEQNEIARNILERNSIVEK